MIFYFLKELYRYHCRSGSVLFSHPEMINFSYFILPKFAPGIFALPRYRSGCKDAIIFNICQVLFSLFLYLFLTRKLQKTTALFD